MRYSVSDRAAFGALWKALLPLALIAAITVIVSCELERQEAVTATESDVPIKVKFKIAEGPSYAQDIQPIFDLYCVSCHGAQKAENGLRLDSYENTMRGTRYGAVLIPGWPEASTLIYVLRRPASQEIAMPHEQRKLTPNRVKNMMYWIEAGALNN
ncbi:MAG: hypothetical protein HY675_11105 [Chloroflexi bacterium]|nr:hypothetical protein [Chloroflexota bacterium]